MSLSTIYKDQIKSIYFTLERPNLTAITTPLTSTICTLTAAVFNNASLGVSFGLAAIAADIDMINTPNKTYFRPEEIMRNEKALCQKAGETEKPNTLDPLNVASMIGKQRILHRGNVHIFEGQGGPNYMQDRALTGKISSPGGGPKIKIFGMLDGHGAKGDLVATLVQHRFPATLKTNLHGKKISTLSESDIYNALRETYRELNSQMRKENLSFLSGTTAAIAIKIANKLFVANVGDSRILLMKKKGDFIQCTEDANIGTVKETACAGLSRFGQKIQEKYNATSSPLERLIGKNNPIDKAAGRLTYGSGFGLNMASTMGDDCCPAALREPSISGPYDLEPGDRLLAASDGVFDHLTSRQVNELCRSKTSPEIPEYLAHLSMGIAYRAYDNSRYEVDNTSVLVTDLFPTGQVPTAEKL